MSAALRLSATSRLSRINTFRASAPAIPHAYGRNATYRRLSNAPTNRSQITTQLSPPVYSFPIQNISILRYRWQPLTYKKFTSSALRTQGEQQRQDEAGQSKQRSGVSEEEEAEPNEKSEGQSGDRSNSDSEQANDGQGRRKQEKKEEPPPPPPHGNKSPWQVFTETLQSEFKASKEWNESTKAIASSAHQFTENESVKRARAAYTAASGAATSTTASAFKTTGKVIGQSAAWTWDTPVVKGVRTGVNATGRGIEKATRPVRETQIYKTAVGGVKDVVDDGSSSRYGGWVEKEERRKQRELRELKEAASPGGTGRRVEKMEEDPE